MLANTSNLPLLPLHYMDPPSHTSWLSFLSVLSAWYLSSSASLSVFSLSASSSRSLSWALQLASPSSTHTNMGTSDSTTVSPWTSITVCEKGEAAGWDTGAVFVARSTEGRLEERPLPAALSTVFLPLRSQCWGPAPPPLSHTAPSHHTPSHSFSFTPEAWITLPNPTPKVNDFTTL